MKSATTNGNCAKSSSRNGRNGTTVSRLMDAERRVQIGERIKRFRGQMRQHQAAEKLGVSTRTYQAWEAGEAATDLDNYEHMAKLFGVKVQDILGTENGEPPWVDELRDLLNQVLQRLDVLEAARVADEISQPVTEESPRSDEDSDAATGH